MHFYFYSLTVLYSVDKDDWDDYDEDDDDDGDDDDDDDEKGLIEANDGDVEDGAKLRHCEGDCDSGKFVFGSSVHSLIFRTVQSLTWNNFFTYMYLLFSP